MSQIFQNVVKIQGHFKSVSNEDLKAHLENVSVLFDFLFNEYKKDDQITIAHAEREFGICSNVFQNAISRGILSAATVPYGKITRKLLSRKEITEKLPLLKTGSRFLRLFNRNHNINTTENVKPKPETEPIQKSKPESTTTQTTIPINLSIDPDRISITAASKEFGVSSTVLKKAVLHGILSAETNKCGATHIILSHKEIQEKLPLLMKLLILKKRSKATPHYHRSDNYNIKQSIEIKKDFLKAEGAPWTSSPCIGCKNVCDPTICNSLTGWIK